MGPEIEYAMQPSKEPLELRVYPGADGAFTLYDDAGDTYAYEKGEHATIPLHWDDKSQTLTIGAREGSYPGMAVERAFRVVVVGGATTLVHYRGQELRIR